MWMNPPRVYDDTIPSSHSTSRITKIVHNIPASRCESMVVLQTRISYREADLTAVTILTRRAGCGWGAAGDRPRGAPSGRRPAAVLS
jgi:hypothetical protein